jgi:predicted GTPase
MLKPDALETLLDVLRQTLEILEPLRTTLPSWHEQIENLLYEAATQRLRIGVVGVTSSGKSAFINGLLGEALLPEQSKATTNLPVICRRGPRRRLKVIYQNDTSEELFDMAVTAEVLRSFCAEDGNPGNTLGIWRLELESPSCCLPVELEVMDTPGTDAYALQGHEQITFDRCLPTADIVIFMISVRRKLSASDLRLLQAVIRNDQRVLFVISQSDIEVDDYERGRLHRSREEKLSNHVRILERDLLLQSGLRSQGVVAVSSLLARQAEGDRLSAEWKQSNFNIVLEHLELFVTDLGVMLTASRAGRSAALVTSLASALQSEAVKKLDADSQETPQESILARQAELLARTEAQIRRSIDHFRDEVTQELNTPGLMAKTVDDLAALDIHDRGAFERLLPLLKIRSEQRTSQIVARLEALRYACREFVSEVGLVPSRRTIQERPPDLGAPPTLAGSIRQQTVEYTESLPRDGFFGGLWDWFAGVRQETRSRAVETVDRDTLIAAVRRFMATSSRELQAYVDEIGATFKALYLEPIQQERESREEGLREIATLRMHSASLLHSLPSLIHELLHQRDRLAEYISKAMGTNPPRIISEGVIQRVASSGSRSPQAVARLALRNVLALAWEAAAIRCFWRIATQAAGREEIPENVMLVAQQPEELGRLSAFLTRAVWPRSAAACSPTPVESGACDSADLLFSHGRGESRLRTLVLNDKISSDDYVKAFEWADVIAVDFDAARLSAGLNSLMALLNFDTLKSYSRKVFFTFGDGAFFDSRLQDVLLEVVPSVVEVTGFGSRPWFIYESSRYDARYSDFIELAELVRRTGGADRELVRQWRQRRLSTRPPFQEAKLQEAFAKLCITGWAHD